MIARGAPARRRLTRGPAPLLPALLPALLAALPALSGCDRPKPAPAAPAAPPPATADATAPVDADPQIAVIDGKPLRWSALQPHLAALRGQEQAELQAALTAASDLLVVREMAVVGAAAAPTETAAQAAERLLAQVWDGQRGCALTEAEVRLAYLQDLAAYKHPPGWTVWDLQSACCGEQHACALIEQERCRGALRPKLQQLAETLRRDFAQLPSLGPAADATLLTLEDSPLKARHLPRMEELAAELQASGAQVRLLRYSFWQQGVPGFEQARFRRGDPAVEAAAQRARIGEVLGPYDGDDAVHVTVVAARQPLALGLPKDPTASEHHPVARQLRGKLCLEAAVAERQQYRSRLVQGASIRWDAAALRGRLAAATIDRLVAMATRGLGR